jgi:hypothetical protein
MRTKDAVASWERKGFWLADYYAQVPDFIGVPESLILLAYPNATPEHLAKLLSGWALHRTGMPVRSVTPGQGSRTDRA